jgi:hypothetical protein
MQVPIPRNRRWHPNYVTDQFGDPELYDIPKKQQAPQGGVIQVEQPQPTLPTEKTTSTTAPEPPPLKLYGETLHLFDNKLFSLVDAFSVILGHGLGRRGIWRYINKDCFVKQLEEFGEFTMEREKDVRLFVTECIYASSKYTSRFVNEYTTIRTIIADIVQPSKQDHLSSVTYYKDPKYVELLHWIVEEMLSDQYKSILITATNSINICLKSAPYRNPAHKVHFLELITHKQLRDVFASYVTNLWMSTRDLPKAQTTIKNKATSAAITQRDALHRSVFADDWTRSWIAGKSRIIFYEIAYNQLIHG